MKARIVRIGNSQGIRIPKSLLEAAGLHDEVDLSSRSGALLIRPARPTRVGWAEAFAETARHEDQARLSDIPRTSCHWDEEEWQW